jgi:hypothetical protein
MRIPIMRRMVDRMALEPTRSVARTRLFADLVPHLSQDDSERLINHVLGWARYADLISVDALDGTVTLKARRPTA